MDVQELQRMLVDHKASMFNEGFLNDQFTKLRRLQNEFDYRDFVFEFVAVFFDEAENLLNKVDISIAQQNVDFSTMGTPIHLIEVNSVGIGAQRVTSVCIVFQKFCQEHNLDECRRCLQQLKHECNLVKNKIEHLFLLEKQIVEAGGSIPRD